MVTLKGKDGSLSKLDLNIAAGMIGDFDGDIYQLLFPSRSAANELRLTEAGVQKAMSQQQCSTELKQECFFDLSKKGIANVASDLRGGKAQISFKYNFLML